MGDKRGKFGSFIFWSVISVFLLLIPVRAVISYYMPEVSTVMSGRFSPHQFCLDRNPWLIGLMNLGDGMIVVSYVLIPLSLGYIVCRQWKLLGRRTRLFMGGYALFIVCCGTTHLLDILTLYLPWYWTQLFTKLITGIVSLPVAIFTIYAIPFFLKVGDPTRLVEEARRLKHDIRDMQHLRSLEAELQLVTDEEAAQVEIRLREAESKVAASHRRIEELLKQVIKQNT